MPPPDPSRSRATPPPPPPPPPPSRGRAIATQVGRALKHRNYRLFFGGQGISLVGTWITRVATSWLVYRLTGSAVMLGIVGFAGPDPDLPAGLRSPACGWTAWTATGCCVVTQVAGHAAVVRAGGAGHPRASSRSGTSWRCSVFQGVINAFDTPARQSFLVDMVEDRADLPNAIALNSSMVNAARLVGPSIAGRADRRVGEGWCFLLDGVSYLAVIGLAAGHARARRPRPAVAASGCSTSSPTASATPSASLPIRAVLLLLALVSARRHALHGADAGHRGADGCTAARTRCGFLMGATGVGALDRRALLASRDVGAGPRRVHPAGGGALRRRPDRACRCRAGCPCFARRCWWSPASASWCRWRRATPSSRRWCGRTCAAE